MTDEVELYHLTVYLKTGNIIRLPGVKRFAFDEDTAGLSLDQETQGERLCFPVRFDDIEAITISPMCPNLDKM